MSATIKDIIVRIAASGSAEAARSINAVAASIQGISRVAGSVNQGGNASAGVATRAADAAQRATARATAAEQAANAAFARSLTLTSNANIAQQAIGPAEQARIAAESHASNLGAASASANQQLQRARGIVTTHRNRILALQGQLLHATGPQARARLQRRIALTRHARNLAQANVGVHAEAARQATQAHQAAVRTARQAARRARVARRTFGALSTHAATARARATSLGNRATALGAVADTATANAESATAAARNAALMQSLANPLIMLTAAVAGSYVVWRELQVHIKALDREMARINTTVIGVRAEITAGDTIRNAKMGLQLSNTTTRFDDSSRLRAFTQENRGNTESRIRAEQAASTRDYAGRQEIREREERSQSIVERGNEARFKTANTATQQAELDKAKTQFAEDKAASKDAFDRKISALNKEKLEQPKQSQGATAAMGAVGNALSLTPLGGLTSAAIGATLGGYAAPSLGADVEAIAGGGMTTSQVGIHNAKLDAEGLREQLERKKQLAKESEIEAGFAAKSVELGRDKSKSLAEQLNTLREATKEARKNFEQDKEKIAENRRTVGGMTPGMRTRMKNIEAKRLRMMQLGNTETFNQSELELPVPEGTKVAAAMRKQREQQGLESGKDILEQDIDIKKSEAEAKATEAAQAAEEPDLVQQIKDTGAKEEVQVKELIKTIQSSYMATKAFDDLEATFKALDEIIKSRIAALKRWV